MQRRKVGICQLSNRRSVVASDSCDAKDALTLVPLPQTCAEMVAQCASVVRRAASPLGGNLNRQSLELLLPINNRRNEFTSVEADDYGQNDVDVYTAAIETASALVRLIDPEGGTSPQKEWTGTTTRWGLFKTHPARCGRS